MIVETISKHTTITLWCVVESLERRAADEPGCRRGRGVSSTVVTGASPAHRCEMAFD
jgi:hypothetical protein